MRALRGLSRPVESRKEKAQVATVSAHNETEIGELVANAFERVGRDGVVSVEEANGTETTLDVVEGMQFDRGYQSPYFITDPVRMQAFLDHPRVLLLDRKLTNLTEFVPLLEEVAKRGRPLLVIAEDAELEPLAVLVVNKLLGVLPCAAVKAPGYGDWRTSLRSEVSGYTGMKHLTGLTKLRSLSLHSTEVTDAGLEYLAGMTDLQELTLTFSDVTGSGLKHLAGLKQFHSLDLDWSSKVTDEGMRELAGLKELRTLNLSASPVTDAAVKVIAGLSKLRHLNIASTKITAGGAAKVQKALPKCRITR